MKVPVTIDLNCLFPPIAPIFEDFQSEWAYINHQGVYNCRIHNLGSCARKLRQPLGSPQLHIIAPISWLQRSITSLSSNLKTKNWKPQHWSDLNDAFWLRCRHLVTAHASSTSLAFNQNRYIQNTELSRLNQIKFNVCFTCSQPFAFYFIPSQHPVLFSLLCSKQRHFPQECILPWTARLWSATTGCSLWSTFLHFSLIYCLSLITFYSFIASSIFPPRLWTANTSPRLRLPD